MTLTPAQLSALESFRDFLTRPEEPAFLLRGYAGTGKTFLLKTLLDELAAQQRNAVLLAPTGRAARVMTQQTGREASTIHRGIYDFKNLIKLEIPAKPGKQRDAGKTFKYHFGLAVNTAVVGTVFVIDEASMVGDAFSESEFFHLGSGRVLSDLLHYVQPTPQNGYKILFVGDRAQLPPVGDRDSWALDKQWLLGQLTTAVLPEVEMTEVVRQLSGSGILANATAVRESIRTQQFASLRLTRGADVQDVEPGQLLTIYLAAGGGPQADDKAIIITYSNNLAQQYNAQVRERFFPGCSQVVEGDRLIITQNNYLDPDNAVYNGEFATVLRAGEAFGVTQQVYVNNQLVEVPLRWRPVRLRIAQPGGAVYEADRLVLDMFLEGPDNSLRSEQVRALYIDAIIRCRAQHGFDDRHPEFGAFLKSDARFNALRVKYGYAITCHKSQGGTWRTAFVDFAGHSGKAHAHYFRWAYTAITRASERLYLLNDGGFTPWEQMRVFDPHTTPPTAPVPLWPEVQRAQTAAFDPLEELEARLGIGQRPAAQVQQFRRVTRRLQQAGIEVEAVADQQNAIRYAVRQGTDRGEVLAYYKNDVPFSKALPFGNATSLTQAATATLNEPLPPGAAVVPATFGPTEPPAVASFYEQFAEAAAEQDIIILSIQHHKYAERYLLQEATGRAVLLLDYDKNGRITGARLGQHDSPTLAQKLSDILHQLN